MTVSILIATSLKPTNVKLRSHMIWYGIIAYGYCGCYGYSDSYGCYGYSDCYGLKCCRKFDILSSVK